MVTPRMETMTASAAGEVPTQTRFSRDTQDDHDDQASLSVAANTPKVRKRKFVCMHSGGWVAFRNWHFEMNPARRQAGPDHAKADSSLRETNTAFAPDLSVMCPAHLC